MTLRQNRIDSKKAGWEEKAARMQRAVCPAGNWRRVMWRLISLTRSPWQQRGGLTPLTCPRRWHQPLDWWREGGEDGHMDGKLWAEHRRAAWLSHLLCSSKQLISFLTSTKQTKRRKGLRVSAFPFEFPRIILMLKATHWNRFMACSAPFLYSHLQEVYFASDISIEIWPSQSASPCNMLTADLHVMPHNWNEHRISSIRGQKVIHSGQLIEP